MKIVTRTSALSLILCIAQAALSQPTPIVIPNGGSASLGSIYFFDPATAKLNPVFEFTTQVSGRNPVKIIINEPGDLLGITESGGKYDHGVIFKVDRNTEEFFTLFENPYGQYKFTNLFYIGGQLYARAKEQGKDGEKVFKVNFNVGDLTLDSSIPPATAGGPDPKLFATNETCDSYQPYKEGFVGLGSLVEKGPPDNPFVIVKGTFLFKWAPPETKIIKLQSWDIRETSNIALYGDIAYYTWKGEAGIQTYDLTSTTMTTLPIDEDYTPVYMLAWDSNIWGLTSSQNFIGFNLKSKSLWTNETSLVNPTGLVLANNKIYFTSYGDLGTRQGSVMVFNIDTKQLKPLVSFGDGPGREPLTSLVKVGEDYYGATGGSGPGTLFSLDKNQKQKTLYTFNDKTGTNPRQLVAHGNRIFGITKSGGREDAGVLFSYQPQNEEFKILYEFTERGARAPVGLVEVNDKLFIACFGGKVVRGDMLVYDINQNRSQVVSSDKWSKASDLMVVGNEIFILGRARGAGMDSWFKFTEVETTPATTQFPLQKAIYINEAGYYLDKGKLYRWKAGAAPTLLMEFPITELNANLSVSGDYLLVSTFPDYSHAHPEGANIHTYNLKTGKSQTLLKAKDFVPPVIKSAATEKLPATFVIEGMGIWVRDAPTTGKVVMKLNDSNVCQVLEKGKYQEIKGVKNFWYKIKFNGQVGWVFGSQGRLE